MPADDSSRLHPPVLNNVVVIGVLVAFAHMTAGSRSRWTDVSRISGDAGKLTLLGAGTTAGIAAMALVLLPALRHAQTRLRAAFDWRHPAVRKMLRLSGWTIGYVVTNQIALLFVLVLAKSGTTGDVSAYLYAYAFYQVPHGLLAVSIMTTMMPELSRSAAQLDFAGLARKFRLGLRYLVLLMLPAAVLFIALAQPMVGVLVRGGFRPHDAAVTADTLQAFSIGLVPFSVYLYALRGFYAARHAHAVRDQRVRERRQRRARTRAVPVARRAGTRTGMDGRLLGRRGPRSGDVGRRVRAHPSIGMSAAPVACGHRGSGASRSLPRARSRDRTRLANRALVATAVAGLAGGVAYVLVLVALRTPELRSLLGTLRRTAPLEV